MFEPNLSPLSEAEILDNIKNEFKKRNRIKFFNKHYKFILLTLREQDIKINLNITRQRLSQIYQEVFFFITDKYKWKTWYFAILGYFNLYKCKKCNNIYKLTGFINQRRFICVDCILKANDYKLYYALQGLKKCLKCKKIKNVTEFHKDNSRLDGYYSYCKNCVKKYQQEHKEKYAARSSRYRTSKLQRIPKWLTVEEINQIEQFYSNRPEGYHVDHIIPLQGENVSGFHCLSNLQYLPASENLTKSNKYKPTIEYFN